MKINFVITMQSSPSQQQTKKQENLVVSAGIFPRKII